MTIRPAITAWCDGSYRTGSYYKGDNIGGGFVLRKNDTGREFSFSRKFNALQDSRKQGAMIAEICAVSAALCAAPKSCHIQIYNDNAGVIKALRNGALSAKALAPAPGKGGHELRVAFNQAMLAMQRHDHVTFQHSKRSDTMMRRAHELANQATKDIRPGAKVA